MDNIAGTTSAAQRVRSLLLAASPDREMATRYLQLFERKHPDSIDRLSTTQSGLQFLTMVFSHSRFLSDALLQHPEWIEALAESDAVYRMQTRLEFETRLRDLMRGSDPASPQLPLAMFRRRELIRILLRDVLGIAQLAEVTEEITDLADAILQVSYEHVRAELVERHGAPQCDSGESTDCGFSVLALGKLGGRELNYSSDIDLMFVYSGNGSTAGASPITNKEFFKKLSNLYTSVLSAYTPDGTCYRVDLRLRPDGSLGEVCLSLEGAKAYYEKRARDWELQMLIKARVAAGEVEPGRDLLEFVQPRIFASTLDFSAVEAVSATRVRIHEKLGKRRTSEGIDVKLARGGIRDIEFLVQCLQRLHGGREPWVRHGGTLRALLRLRDKSLLSESEYSRLVCAYEFLRHLEHRMQVLDDRQTHALPLRKDELELIARRMPRRELGRAPSGDKLLHQLNAHLEEVQETYDRVIHSQQRSYYGGGDLRPAASGRENADVLLQPASNNLIRFLDDRAPGLARSLSERSGAFVSRSFELFLEKIYVRPEHLKLLDSNPPLVQDTLELFESSPHLAEVLNRHTELIEELAGIRNAEGNGVLDQLGRAADSGELRRCFQRGMLRVQAESICRGVPIFETLEKTSDLADRAIAAAYRLALQQVLELYRPEKESYTAASQLMVIALGRLGMREFDLGSDADLIFVLPDEDAAEVVFWTRVAEQMIGIISAYTGQGIVFSVDTRLRPNGREGGLVQTVASYKDYLANRAEAWEGIAYMKARSVAGNSRAAIQFLYELQEVDWIRYGQSGRSRTDLRAMRSRLEREQGSVSPLKSGAGSFYDIDFMLLYLRLRGAGIFYKALNTPERIGIVEEMGLLEKGDAEFLLHAAAFYRAIDHGLRLYSGHAEGKLPHSQAQLENLTKLVRRWTPEQLHDAPLADKLAQIQAGTRALFQKLFG